MLGKDTMVPFELFNEPWVLFRDAEGKPSCIRDSCAHRACPLSLGKVEQGRVSCAYHGWKFDGQGRCTEMPSTAFCRNVAVAALPCAEKDGFVWVFPGAGTPPAEVRPCWRCCGDGVAGPAHEDSTGGLCLAGRGGSRALLGDHGTTSSAGAQLHGAAKGL